MKGLYDLELKWTPDAFTPNPFGAPPLPTTAAADHGGISIFTAIQEQLGLKLESARAPLEVLIIDSIQKPSDN